MIPGQNILAQALTLIAAQSFQYYAFANRSLQPNGQYLPNYAAPLSLFGSVQPVPRYLYEEYGLEFQRNYNIFYVEQNVIDVDRDVSGDLMNFGGNSYQCLSKTNWFAQDGWDAILCVQIPTVPLITSFSPPLNGIYNTSQQLVFTVVFNMVVTATGSPYIQLSALSGLIHGNATYQSGSGANTLIFAYTIQSSDTAIGIAAASPLIGTVQNASGTITANTGFTPPDLSGITLN